MAVHVDRSVLLSGRVDAEINHPDGGEQEEEDEEGLQVRGANVHVAVGTAADQGTAQEQDVEADDRGDHQSPVASALLDGATRRDVALGRAGAFGLAGRATVVGQVRLLRLRLFDHHPAGLTESAISQALAGKAAVQTHASLSLCEAALQVASFETFQRLHPPRAALQSKGPALKPFTSGKISILIMLVQDKRAGANEQKVVLGGRNACKQLWSTLSKSSQSC